MFVQQQIMLQQMQGIPPPYSNFLLLPPGSQFGPFTPAIVIVEELNPAMTQILQIGLNNLESPDVSASFAQSLQVQAVFNCSDIRQMQLQSGLALAREFDAIGYPPYQVAVHGLLLLMQGPNSVVKVMIAVHTQRWTEFLAPCLQFAGGINVSGGVALPASVMAIADPRQPELMQLNIINPKTHQPIPAMYVPTGATYNVTVNMTDNSTTVNGSIQGAGIAVGQHSLASNANPAAS